MEMKIGLDYMKMRQSTTNTHGSIVQILLSDTNRIYCGVIVIGQKREFSISVRRKAKTNRGIAPGEHSVENLLKKLYGANPEAVINGP